MGAEDKQVWDSKLRADAYFCRPFTIFNSSGWMGLFMHACPFLWSHLSKIICLLWKAYLGWQHMCKKINPSFSCFYGKGAVIFSFWYIATFPILISWFAENFWSISTFSILISWFAVIFSFWSTVHFSHFDFLICWEGFSLKCLSREAANAPRL